MSHDGAEGAYDALDRSTINTHRTQDVTSGSMSLRWSGIGLTVKPSKPSLLERIFRPKLMKAWKEAEPRRLLEHIPGHVSPGQMLGIMGESGAGKTLLLRVLAGKIQSGQQVEGKLLVNGHYRLKRGWDRKVSYQPTGDLASGNLTVRETIRFSAKIKLPRSQHTFEQLEAFADELVGAVGLGHCADTRCRFLSTGERRRLSLAEELAGQRKLLCLDEPTSGLDGSTALALTRLLRHLAQRYSLTIICVVHQPRAEVLELYDKLLLLARGRCMFFGPLDMCLSHFESVSGISPDPKDNPADYLMDMIARDRCSSTARMDSEKRYRAIRNSWVASGIGDFQGPDEEPEGVQTVELPTDEWPNSNWTEFTLLLSRYMLEEFRDVKGCLCFFLLFLALGLLHGFLYFQLTLDNFGGFQSRLGTPIKYYFILVVLGVCVAVFSVPMTLISGHVAGVFFEEARLLKSELHSRTFRLQNALNARLVAVLPVPLLTMTVFGIVLYYLSGLRTDSFTYLLIFLGFIWLSLLTVLLLGVMLAYLSIPLLGVYLGMGFFAVCGLPVRIPDITPILSWLRFVSPAYYSIQGTAQSECSGLQFNDGFTGDEYLALFAFDELSVVWCAGAMMITLVFYYGFAWLSVWYKTRPHYTVL